jgi:L-rhamnose-H+ transport protein
VLCLVMFGGLITNATWCAWLIVRNRSAAQWAGASAGEARPPLLANWLLCALAGTAWYFQFFFYTMGESQMGRFGFSSWTLHMASIILFSTLWGFALNEWAEAGSRTRRLVWLGIGTLVGSTMIIGFSNYLAAR